MSDESIVRDYLKRSRFKKSDFSIETSCEIHGLGVFGNLIALCSIIQGYSVCLLFDGGVIKFPHMFIFLGLHFIIGGQIEHRNT